MPLFICTKSLPIWQHPNPINAEMTLWLEGYVRLHKLQRGKTLTFSCPFFDINLQKPFWQGELPSLAFLKDPLLSSTACGMKLTWRACSNHSVKRMLPEGWKQRMVCGCVGVAGGGDDDILTIGKRSSSCNLSFYKKNSSRLSPSPPSATAMLLFPLGFFNHGIKPQFSSHGLSKEEVRHLWFVQRLHCTFQPAGSSANIAHETRTLEAFHRWMKKQLTTAGRTFWFLRWQPLDYTLTYANCSASSGKSLCNWTNHLELSSYENVEGSISNGKHKCSLSEDILGGYWKAGFSRNGHRPEPKPKSWPDFAQFEAQ